MTAIVHDREAPMRADYNGHETLTFTDYLDLGTGKTLTAEPGQSYDVAPASGRAVPDIPEGWFTAADPEAWAAEQAEAERLAAESAAAESGEGPAPDGSGEPQQQAETSSEGEPADG